MVSEPYLGDLHVVREAQVLGTIHRVNNGRPSGEGRSAYQSWGGGEGGRKEEKLTKKKIFYLRNVSPFLDAVRLLQSVIFYQK